MKSGFRQSMNWLHTWSCLTVGWVLFYIFLTGTAGYFDTEIDRWMRPELPVASQRIQSAQAVDFAVARLQSQAPEAKRWFFTLPADRNDPLLRVFWERPPQDGARFGQIGREILDVATGRPMEVRDTGGGQTLYKMHRRFHYMPGLVAEWIIGICTMLMLVGMITGVVVHKRIFQDFFTFRPGTGQRSWLDAHNMLAVLALPFHLMITFSGLVFFIVPLLAPVITLSYGGDKAAIQSFYGDLFGREKPPPRVGTPAPLTAFGPLLARAEARMGAGELRFVSVSNPGDAGARISFSGGPETPSQERIELTFDGLTGELLHESGPRSPVAETYHTVLGLHEGLFAGPALRWAYFLAGLLGTAMIAAGQVLWTVKRRAKGGDRFGFYLVERLNLGTLVGLPIAIAAYFWANRLIPAGFADRAAWEVHAMHITWAVLLLHAFGRPAAKCWVEQLWIAAAAFSLLPGLNALTTGRHLGVSLPAGEWDLAGFDLAMSAFGLAFGYAAWMIGPKLNRTGLQAPAAGAKARGADARRPKASAA